MERWIADAGDLTFSEWLDERRARATERRNQQALYRSPAYQVQMAAMQNCSPIAALQQMYGRELQTSRVGQAIPIPGGLLSGLGGWLK